MNRHRLAANGRRTRKKNGVALASPLLENFEDRLVVQLGVEIVHLLRIRTVEVRNLERDSLPKIGLECIDSLIHKLSKLPLEPGLGVRVGEVH